MICDREGKSSDWMFVEPNPAFEKNNSITDVVGKTILELTPDIKPKWFKIYNRVATSSEPTRFVEGSEALRRWFDIYAFRVGGSEERKVAVLFNDIMSRKRAEEDRAESVAQLEAERARTRRATRFAG